MKLEWYCQTKDFKMHTLGSLLKFEEQIPSESDLEKFFEDKIVFGCKRGKNFIEVAHDENTLRVSINGKEKFLSYGNYNELVSLFNSQYEMLLKAENSKDKKSANGKKLRKSVLFEIIGFAIIAAACIFAVLCLLFFDLSALNKKVVENVAGLFIMILGVGMLMTFPKCIEDYENSEGSFNKGCAIPILGIMFVAAGFWTILF